MAFHALVQKALTLNLERAEKLARLQSEKDRRRQNEAGDRLSLLMLFT